MTPAAEDHRYRTLLERRASIGDNDTRASTAVTEGQVTSSMCQALPNAVAEKGDKGYFFLSLPLAARQEALSIVGIERES